MSQSKGSASFFVGLALIIIGAALLLITFYLAISSFEAVRSVSSFNSYFGGALQYLRSYVNSTNAFGALGSYANLIIVLLIMAVFLGIALAAGSVALSKGVEAIKGR